MQKDFSLARLYSKIILVTCKTWIKKPWRWWYWKDAFQRSRITWSCFEKSWRRKRYIKFQIVFFKNPNSEILLGDLCADDVRGIESWTFDLSVEDENLLTDSGKLEHTQFGQRMKKRLPTLLGGSYNSEQITVRTKILSFFREIIENVKVLLLSYK